MFNYNQHRVFALIGRVPLMLKCSLVYEKSCNNVCPVRNNVYLCTSKKMEVMPNWLSW